MNNINVVISGPTNTGKSSILYLIKTLLKDHKFTVIGDGGLDFVDETSFDEHAQRGINAKLDAIKKATTITITEKMGSSDLTSPWIKLSECEPQVDQKCWVCDEDENVFICRYTEYNVGFFKRKTSQRFLNLLCGMPIIENPVKWQPFKIPKP